MNLEKIGKTIKEIRTKAGLSQEKFAEKYHVTYQAVSKWENGKNIPDLSILQAICQDYNLSLDELLGQNQLPKTKSHKLVWVIILLLILIIGSIIFLVKKHTGVDFKFQTIQSTCQDFDLYGSIAFNKNKSYIYIDNITYCGDELKEQYTQITCSLMAQNENTITIIDSVSKNSVKPIELSQFLKEVSFKIDNYENICHSKDEDNLYLELNAITSDKKEVIHKIPLSLKSECL